MGERSWAILITSILVLTIFPGYQTHLSEEQSGKEADGRQSMPEISDVDNVQATDDLCPDEPDDDDDETYQNVSLMAVDDAGCMHIQNWETGEFNFENE